MTLSSEMSLLRSSLSCCTYRGDQHTDVHIKEHDTSAKLKSITLKAANGDWFSFDPDSGRGRSAVMSPLLSTAVGHSHNRACDCVVLVRSGEKLTAIYIDLKSSSPSGYAGQFKSTRQFVRYVLGLLSEFHNCSLVISEERFVVLHTGRPASINKTTTVPKAKNLSQTQPDRPYKREVLTSSSIYLRELLT